MSESRIRLVPFDRNHVPRFMALSHDPELIETMGWRPFSPGEEERFVETMLVLTVPCAGSGPATVFSIAVGGEDRVAGFVSLKGANAENSSAELGIAIMEKEYRNQGHGTEALRLALEYAFGELGLGLVALTVFPDNGRAISAYEKVGFKATRVLERSWLQPNGEYADLLLMEATRPPESP